VYKALKRLEIVRIFLFVRVLILGWKNDKKKEEAFLCLQFYEIKLKNYT
jgi:hypothetical protein